MNKRKKIGYIVNGEMGPMFIHRDGYLYTQTRGFRVTMFDKRRLAELAIRARRAYNQREHYPDFRMSVHPVEIK